MLLGDQAAFYRELMPGHMAERRDAAVTGATALAIHRGFGTPGRRDFWSLSATVFVALAVDELTQPMCSVRSG